MANSSYKKITHFHQLVENMCKSTCKYQCNFRVKNCVFPLHPHTPRAKLTISTNFSHASHNFSHNTSTPIHQLFFPLFHSPYNYYY